MFGAINLLKEKGDQVYLGIAEKLQFGQSKQWCTIGKSGKQRGKQPFIVERRKLVGVAALNKIQ